MLVGVSRSHSRGKQVAVAGLKGCLRQLWLAGALWWMGSRLPELLVFQEQLDIWTLWVKGC